MGFISGVITGLGIAAAAAAWYMSRAGSEFRERYRVDKRLGDFGDEMELRTRDVRANMGAQVELTFSSSRRRFRMWNTWRPAPERAPIGISNGSTTMSSRGIPCTTLPLPPRSRVR